VGTGDVAIDEWLLNERQVVSGDLVGPNAFGDLRKTGTAPLSFTDAVTTTGTFIIASTSASTATGSIEFAAGETYTFENIDWLGLDAGNTIELRSSIPGSQWELAVPGTQIAVGYLQVSDSDASLGQTIFAASSTDAGNNTNWSFNGGSPVGVRVWNTNDWTQYDVLTINSTKVDEVVTDFPVYVNLADLSSDFWSTTPADANLAGTDIRVTTDSETPVELSRELVFASSSTQTGELHFKADSISSTTDTIFRIYYNGSTTGDYNPAAVYGAQNVWTNGYTAVYHAEGGGTDSTTNGYDMTANGDATAVPGGQLGSAFDLDGAGDYYSIANLNAHGGRDQYTISAWSYLNTLGSGNVDDAAVFSYGPAGSNADLLWYNYNQIDNNSEQAYSFNADTISNDNNRVDAATTPVAQEWHYVTGVRNADVREIFYNGVSEGQSSGATINNSASAEARIGSWAETANLDFNGLLDEVRISTAVRSAGWINSEYINQSSTTNFYTIVNINDVALGTGSSTVANHDNGQISDTFNSQNKTNESLYAFKLIPQTGTATVTQLKLELSGVRQVEVSNFANIRLLRDHDADAEYDISDEVIAVGTMSIADTTGTIEFNTEFLSTTTQNYLVVADWTAPQRGALMTINLAGGGIAAVDVDGIHTFIGVAASVQHSRANRGGGGSSIAIGDPAPVGDGDRTGGSNEGGNEVGQVSDGDNITEDPDFYKPTSHGVPNSNFVSAQEAYESDNVRVSTNDGDRHSYSGFGLNIPSGNAIMGIEVKLDASVSVDTYTYTVYLSGNNGTSYTSGKTTNSLVTSDTIETLGSPSDLWGQTWTPLDFADGNFVLDVLDTGGSNSLDAIQVRVYHQASGGSAGGGGAI
jgi:hypothetical protein